MILVESIKYKTVRDDFVKYTEAMPNMSNCDPAIPGDLLDKLNLKSIIVTGEHFKNEMGQTVVIGMNPDVQSLIGLPFKSFKKMSDVIQKQNAEIANLRQTLNEAHTYVDQIEHFTFIGILKFWWSKKKLRR